ncbi:MAG: TRAP transporter TatT component family protein [Myxococcales bacterium]
MAAAIAAYEAASKAPGATVQTFERLVRLRQFEAETHPEKSDARAKAYALCLADGLQGLSRFGAADGTPLALPDAEALDAARAQIGKAASSLFYETVSCYGLTISSLPLFSRAGAAKRFKRLLERAVELDPTVKEGGPHRSLSFFLLTAPGFIGGDDEAARSHAEAALKRNPRYADNVHLHALVVLCPSKKTKAKCLEALREASVLPDDAVPELMPEQRIWKKKAREELRARGGLEEASP